MAVKIHELRAKRATIVAKMKELHLKDADTEEGMSAEDASTFNNLGDELAKLDERVARCEAMLAADGEEAKAAKSKDDDSEDDADTEKLAPAMSTKSLLAARVPALRVPAQAKAVVPADGFRAIQMLMAKAYDRMERKSDDRWRNGAAMIKATYGESEVMKALSAFTAPDSNGPALLPQAFLNELIQYLRSKTVMRQIGATHLDLPVGNLRIPRQTGTATANWTAENTDIATSVPTFDDINLTRHKLTAMTPSSNELIRFSPISAEMIIRNDLSAVVSRAEDLAFLRGAGTNGQPTGLLNLATSANVITYTGSTTDAGAVLGFLTSLVNAIEVDNVDLASGVWIMPVSVKNYLVSIRNGLGYPFFPELSDMQLLGYPVFTTTQLPTNLTNSGGTAGAEIYFVSATEFLIADAMDPTLEVSREASYMDVGTNTLVSAWSRDQTVWRMIESVDCNIRHPVAVAVGLVNAFVPAG